MVSPIAFSCVHQVFIKPVANVSRLLSETGSYTNRESSNYHLKFLKFLLSAYPVSLKLHSIWHGIYQIYWEVIELQGI
jgi:hypothetical protein